MVPDLPGSGVTADAKQRQCCHCDGIHPSSHHYLCCCSQLQAFVKVDCIRDSEPSLQGEYTESIDGQLTGENRQKSSNFAAHAC